MQQSIRAHGNAVEYIPIFLILLFLFEVNGGTKMALHIAGMSFMVARIAHAVGLHQSAGASIGRVVGSSASVVIILVLAVTNILRYT